MRQITSLQHPLVKHLVKLRKERSYRQEKKSALVEGKKMVGEIAHRKHLFVTDESLVVPAEEVYLVPQEVMEKVCGSKTPEGIVAEVELPKQSVFTDVSHLLVLDGVSDPGNLGTLLRTALALKWEGVFLLDNCCDPFNDKALRAAKGATFQLPLFVGSFDELQKAVKNNRLTPLVADLEGEELDALHNCERPLLILGSEANGPSDAIKAFAKKVTIPISDQAESLNVAIAGAILLYFMRPKW